LALRASNLRMACKPDFVQALQPLMTIHLGALLPAHSSSQPGPLGGRTRACARETPIWLCSWRGLPCPRGCPQGGGLLPHRFTLTLFAQGGLFSVALSLGLPRPAVNRRHAFLESGLSSHMCSHPAIRAPNIGAALQSASPMRQIENIFGN